MDSDDSDYNKLKGNLDLKDSFYFLVALVKA